jgi:hypothetical protein
MLRESLGLTDREASILMGDEGEFWMNEGELY